MKLAAAEQWALARQASASKLDKSSSSSRGGHQRLRQHTHLFEVQPRRLLAELRRAPSSNGEVWRHCFSSPKSARARPPRARRRAPRRALAAAKPRNASESASVALVWDEALERLPRPPEQPGGRPRDRAARPSRQQTPIAPAGPQERVNHQTPWCATSSIPRRARKNGSTSSSV